MGFLIWEDRFRNTISRTVWPVLRWYEYIFGGAYHVVVIDAAIAKLLTVFRISEYQSFDG